MAGAETCANFKWKQPLRANFDKGTTLITPTCEHCLNYKPKDDWKDKWVEWTKDRHPGLRSINFIGKVLWDFGKAVKVQKMNGVVTSSESDEIINKDWDKKDCRIFYPPSDLLDC